jgi:hypothetical protein
MAASMLTWGLVVSILVLSGSAMALRWGSTSGDGVIPDDS